MKLLLALYFFILAFIQLGLLFGIYHYYRTQNSIKPSLYWMNSLFVNVLALFTFGGGIIIIQDVAKPEFNFTIANTLFIVSAALQGLFCQSLSRDVTKRELVGFALATLVFMAAFEYMRRNGTFELRTVVMATLASILYMWQILAIRKKRKLDPSSQLRYFLYASSGELLMALCRLAVLGAQTIAIRDVEQIPQLLILFTIFQLVMNTLSFIAIGGYWSERISIENVRSEFENKEIKDLLHERELLIGSLLKANKTAATGALSASIAHELNQPLGASSLNIQFLQKKLADGQLPPEQQKEVLDTLLADNERAANIIRSLRSIFAEEAIQLENLNIYHLIESILDIVRPECTNKKIQIEVDVPPNLSVQMNRSEMQQVLLNLLNNAIHAVRDRSNGQRQILIQGRRAVGGIEISVSDTGAGVPPSSRSQLFELLSVSMNKGMGLGLWLCKHIVSRHGGKIWYEEREGGGAKFAFVIPAK